MSTCLFHQSTILREDKSENAPPFLRLCEPAGRGNPLSLIRKSGITSVVALSREDGSGFGRYTPS